MLGFQQFDYILGVFLVILILPRMISFLNCDIFL